MELKVVVEYNENEYITDIYGEYILEEDYKLEKKQIIDATKEDIKALKYILKDYVK